MPKAQLKIALHQLYSNGDCLFATIVARQIKEDFPGCHLSWYIASHCKSMILNNPDVDEIIEVDAKSISGDVAWRNTEKMLRVMKEEGKYDHVFSTQILDHNERNYTGTIRSTILKNYGGPITVNTKPYVYLNTDECSNVAAFIERHKIKQYRNVVLFECQPLSGQVPMSPVLAEEIARIALESLEDTCFILTSGQKIQSADKRIFDASELSIRENAELINSCTHLLGCSSGISWLALSSWCKTVPMLQLMNNRSFYYNSFCRDSLILKEDSNHIIETLFISKNHLVGVIISFITDLKNTRKQFHKELPDRSRTVYSLCRRHIIQGQSANALQIIKNTYFLNKHSFHYYKTILRLAVMYLFFLGLRAKNNLRKAQ